MQINNLRCEGIMNFFEEKKRKLVGRNGDVDRGWNRIEQHKLAKGERLRIGFSNGVGCKYQPLSDSLGMAREPLLATPLLITTYQSKPEQSFRAMLFLWYPNLA